MLPVPVPQSEVQGVRAGFQLCVKGRWGHSGGEQEKTASTWDCRGLLTADVEATGRGKGKDVIEIGIQEESL